MTSFLASVRSGAEARLVVAASVDILDVKEPDGGALGAVPHATLQEVVACARGAVPVSATIGDIPLLPELVAPAIQRTWNAGVDIVKVGVFADAVAAPLWSMFTGFCTQGMRIVLVFFAEQWRDNLDYGLLRQAGIMGVMLDTRDKRSGSLSAKVRRADLQAFVRHARQERLITGLAGSLSETDIPDLLSLAPDYLGFRGALCGGAARRADIDPAAVRRIADRMHEHARRRAVVTPRGDHAASETLMAVQ